MEGIGGTVAQQFTTVSLRNTWQQMIQQLICGMRIDELCEAIQEAFSSIENEVTFLRKKRVDMLAELQMMRNELRHLQQLVYTDFLQPDEDSDDDEHLYPHHEQQSESEKILFGTIQDLIS
jgi:hypothetical protein